MSLRWSVLAFCIFFAGCKATPPGKLETAVITRAKHKLFVGSAGAKNPLDPTADNIKNGQQVFAQYCVACHGLDGQTTGVPFADRMSPPVPSLASRDVQFYSDGQLKWVIDNGLWPTGMPGSKGILNDDEIWATVLYIRHLPPAGSLGEPCMYSGDDCARESNDDTKPDARRETKSNATAAQKGSAHQHGAASPSHTTSNRTTQPR